MPRRLACLALLILPPCTALRADDWPGWLGPKRDGVWRETGVLDKLPKDGPKRLWAEKIGGGYAGPAVVDGRVYVADKLLKPGAAALDVGITRTSAGLVGDVDQAAWEVAGWVAPMPGGVGPMTRAMLLANVVEAAEATLARQPK